MQTKAITISATNDIIPPGEITAATINKKALELGQAGARLMRTGAEMVTIAIELGRLLEAKAAIIADAGSSWLDWQEENLEFSRQSADNYRKLFRNREAITGAMARGQVGSIRQALAILSKEPGMETPELPGIEPKPPAVKTVKTECVFSRLWKIFKEPSKAPREEREAFVIHTAEACRIAKENNWALPGITIELNQQPTGRQTL
jgi:hypothetical protein